MTANPSATADEPLAAASAAPDRAAGYALETRRVRLQEQANNCWGVIVPAGTPVEALTGEKLWSNVADKFHEGDQIHVRTDDGLYYVRLYVRGAARTWLKVAVLETHIFAGEPRPAARREHAVKYLGSHLKWGVVRLSDGSVISPPPGFETEATARRWLDGHEAALKS